MRAATAMAAMVVGLGLAWPAIAAAEVPVPLVPKPDVPRPVGTPFAWPLEQAPSLVAHAQVDLAAERCAKLRDDGRVTTRYALAWCAVGHVDALESLAALRAIGERDAGYYGRAARADVVDLLADRLTVAEQLHWLTAYGSGATYDRLVATLVELGRRGDALGLALATPRDTSSVMTACRRAARNGALQDHATAGLVTDVEAALIAIGRPDLTWHACEWVVSRAVPEDELSSALDDWPADRSEYHTWITIAWQAVRALPTDEAVEVMIAALTNASILGGCDARRDIADVIRSASSHGAPKDPRLRALLAPCP